MLFCGSVWAKEPQTITFNTAPPRPAVAGGSYEVSATSSAGLPVPLFARGACSFTPPRAPADQTLRPARHEKQPERTYQSPAKVYFVGAGTCTISAGGFEDSEYEAGRASQAFPVVKDPSERITFVSKPPSKATVGGEYHPQVHLSAGIEVSFAATTASVCTIEEGAVRLLGVGTCTIAARQNGVSEAAPPEAQQSFVVSQPLTRGHKRNLGALSIYCEIAGGPAPGTASPTEPRATIRIMGLAKHKVVRELRKDEFTGGHALVYLAPGDYEVSGFSRPKTVVVYRGKITLVALVENVP
jgi:hypothetical protein